MTAVSTPPASHLAPASPTPIPGDFRPAASGRCTDACRDELPADFASMLKVLQSLTGVANADISASAKVLSELDQVAEGQEIPVDPTDMAALLGQINALTAAHAAPVDPAADQTTARDRNAAEAPGRGRLDITALAGHGKNAEPTAGLADQDAAEPKPDLSTLDAPAADPASLRSADVNQARGPHTEKTRLDVATPVHSPNWSAEVGQRVVWMASNHLQEAQLSINPPHLGPIEITLSLKDDQATARFFSPHAEIREILEQAMPRLREMLAGAGVQLGQSDVGGQSQQAFQQFAGRQNAAGQGQPSFSEEHPSLHAPNAVNPSVSLRTLHGNGLVDTFV